MITREIFFHVQDDSHMSCNSEDLYVVYDVHSVSKKEAKVPVKIGNKIVHVQFDTGCAYSLAPKTFYDQYCSNVPLKPTSVLLLTYIGETLYPLGEANIKLEYAGQEYSLPLIIVPKGSNALFGRNWLLA